MAISKIVTNSISDNSITSSKFAISAQIPTPTITSPANNATNINNDQLITASPYLSLYGIAQANALFQISTSPTFAFINVESTITGSNTQFQANASSGLVANTTTHFARVRYSDTSNNSSAFSDTVQFTTKAAFTIDIDFLVLAGGGGGGFDTGGGGGAGGYQELTGQPISPSTNYTVTVGGGGNGATGTGAQGSSGSNSVFSTTTSIGGGGGGTGGSGVQTARSGGSGGGSAASGSAGTGIVGQGNNGGTSAGRGAGGGGAGGVGLSGTGTDGGNGGTGTTSSISGSPVCRAGGGGGGTAIGTPGSATCSGSGGGSNATPATNATPANMGAGGGGGMGSGAGSRNGGNGSSGVVILKYPDTFTISNPGGGLTLSTAGPSGGFKVTTITVGTGNVQFN